MAAKTKKPAKKAKARERKPAAPPFVVPNYPFAPGVKVGFHLDHTVGVERNMGREPFAKPVKTAKVKANGVLEVRGLPRGQWCAAGPVGDSYRYIQFGVR